MIVLIDNYDSFTYNIYHQLGSLGVDIKVIRNDVMTADDILAMQPQAIVISPGPGIPKDAGICLELIEKIDALPYDLPLFGICLGHQAIGEFYGGDIVITEPKHGKVDSFNHNNDIMFSGIPKNFKATRYHSLVIDKNSFTADKLIVTATSNNGLIMGLRHKTKPIFGVQFHPESIKSEYGSKLMSNFLTNIKD